MVFEHDVCLLAFLIWILHSSNGLSNGVFVFKTGFFHTKKADVSMSDNKARNFSAANYLYNDWLLAYLENLETQWI